MTTTNQCCLFQFAKACQKTVFFTDTIQLLTMLLKQSKHQGSKIVPLDFLPGQVTFLSHLPNEQGIGQVIWKLNNKKSITKNHPKQALFERHLSQGQACSKLSFFSSSPEKCYQLQVHLIPHSFEQQGYNVYTNAYNCTFPKQALSSSVITSALNEAFNNSSSIVLTPGFLDMKKEKKEYLIISKTI